jgi:hypothetical protein
MYTNSHPYSTNAKLCIFTHIYGIKDNINNQNVIDLISAQYEY